MEARAGVEPASFLSCLGDNHVRFALLVVVNLEVLAKPSGAGRSVRLVGYRQVVHQGLVCRPVVTGALVILNCTGKVNDGVLAAVVVLELGKEVEHAVAGLVTYTERVGVHFS